MLLHAVLHTGCSADSVRLAEVVHFKVLLHAVLQAALLTASDLLKWCTSRCFFMLCCTQAALLTASDLLKWCTSRCFFMLCCTEAALLTVSDLLELCISWCFFLSRLYFSLGMGIVREIAWYWCALHGAFLLELALCRFHSCGTDMHFKVPFFLNWFYVGITRVVLTCTSRCPSPAVSYQTEPSGGHICAELRIKSWFYCVSHFPFLFFCFFCFGFGWHYKNTDRGYFPICLLFLL